MQSFRGGQILAIALVVLARGAPRGALAHEHDEHAHGAAGKFGKVDFAVSCKADVRAAFDQAVAQMHSFAYGESASTFQDVFAKDPACGMAQWGVAMTYFHQIWGPPTDAEFAAGRAAAQKAAAVSASTPRERARVA
jgi:hypothetical protein